MFTIKKSLLMGAALLGVLTFANEVSFTIDDPYTSDTIKLSGRERDASIRKHLRDSGLKAALFICGMRVNDAAGKELLTAWDRDQHLLANHSYTHPYLNSSRVTADFLQKEILRTDKILSGFKHFERFFRFPYLKEGETAEKRDAVRAFMRENNYRHGAVTIDASDWYISERLRKRLVDNPRADTSAYRDFYLKHIWERSQYYDGLSKAILGREIKHTLLIHHNLLNALYLGDLIAMFKERGWKTIHAKDAYREPVFDRAPNIAPAGESLIWGLAKESGLYESQLRYPAEDGDYEKAEMDRLGL